MITHFYRWLNHFPRTPCGATASVGNPYAMSRSPIMVNCPECREYLRKIANDDTQKDLTARSKCVE